MERVQARRRPRAVEAEAEEAMEVVLAEQRRGASGGAAVGEAYVGGDADGRGVNESLRHWRRFHLCQLQMARPLRESRRLMLISSLHNENVRTSSRLSAAAISASAHVCCGGPRIVVRPTPVCLRIYLYQACFVYTLLRRNFLSQSSKSLFRGSSIIGHPLAPMA